jgi:hypothetical protein
MLSIYEGIVAVGKLTGSKRVDIREVRLRLIPLECGAPEQYSMDNGWLKLARLWLHDLAATNQNININLMTRGYYI